MLPFLLAFRVSSPVVHTDGLCPAAGGRFPSDLQVPRQQPYSPSSGSSEPEPEAIGAVGAIPGSSQHNYSASKGDPYRMDGVPSSTRPSYEEPRQPAAQRELAQRQAELSQQPNNVPPPTQTAGGPPFPSAAQPVEQEHPAFANGAPGSSLARHPTEQYGDWMAPVAAGVAGAGAGTLGTEAYRRHQQDAAVPEDAQAKEEKHGVLPQTTAQWGGDTTDSSDNANAANAGVAPAVGGGKSPGEILRDAQGRLGGLEGRGAHETGKFPTVVRHDTDMSISALHVPGQFPKKT